MTAFAWRGPFTNTELNQLHAEAFEQAGSSSDNERDWENLLARYSLGWVVAREGDSLVGFVYVAWDGFTHAWIQDVMVSSAAGRRGLGTQLVTTARDAATAAGCKYLHVDFEPHLRGFYLDACGFEPSQAGLIRLRETHPT